MTDPAAISSNPHQPLPSISSANRTTADTATTAATTCEDVLDQSDRIARTGKACTSDKTATTVTCMNAVVCTVILLACAPYPLVVFVPLVARLRFICCATTTCEHATFDASTEYLSGMIDDPS